ncbi:threonylcarbamoyl-AMP synthase [Tissierella creatinini]|nr:threonylcarbamoyl-AMP synthase [Tissierella creatinini]TJX63863.1 threonylcarbamoyl-AMP synthase [Soehngenia saccharolytica]
MKTKIVKINSENIDEDLISEAASLIKEGKLVAFPTETVYGLGANGLDEEAVIKIFEAKGRPQDNPLILHIESIDQLMPLVEYVPEIAYQCIERFWPGPLTMIFKRSSLVPDVISGGLDTVAIRMPENKIARELIRWSKVPIAAPSANLSGKPSPTAAHHVIRDLLGRVDMIIDGGSTGVGLESTVLDLSGDIPMVLRPGGITIEDLKEIIPNVTQDLGTIKESEDIVPKSPGQKYRHYAPLAEMRVYTGDVEDIVKAINLACHELKIQGRKIGIMATVETKDRYNLGIIVKVVGTREQKETIAANLFDVIRQFDDEDVDIILAEGVETDQIGMAIMNRMMKASGGKIIQV